MSSTIDGDQVSERAFRRAILVSVVLHIIAFVLAGSMTLFRATGTVYAPTYTVDLVSLPPSPGAPGKGDGSGSTAPGPESKPAPEPAVKVAPEPPPEPAPEPAPEQAPEPAPKAEAPPVAAPPKKPSPPPVAPPKKTPAPAAQPAKKPAPPPPQEVTREVKPSGGDEAAVRLERKRRIEELEQEARQIYESLTSQDSESREAAAPASPSPAGEEKTGSFAAGTAASGSPGTGTQRRGLAGGGGIEGPGGGGGGGQPANIRFRAYFDLVWSRIRSSWLLPEGVATSDRLLTVVGIRIAPDGRILDYRVEKGSGNAYYDQSAIRAIRKSDPLPPLPEEIGEEPLEIGVNFRYPE